MAQTHQEVENEDDFMVLLEQQAFRSEYIEYMKNI